MFSFLSDKKGMTLLEIMVAIVIFAIGLLSMGMMIPYSTRKITHAKARTTSVTLTQRFLDEVAAYAFDEKEADGTLATLSKVTPSDLTPPGMLGPDANESYGSFDDVDDFNGFVQDPIPNYNNFKASISVSYCYANGDTTASTPTFYKKITVKITPIGGNEPVSISTVVSYKG